MSDGGVSGCVWRGGNWINPETTSGLSSEGTTCVKVNWKLTDAGEPVMGSPDALLQKVFHCCGAGLGPSRRGHTLIPGGDETLLADTIKLLSLE